jgi:hypothetical protein
LRPSGACLALYKARIAWSDSLWYRLGHCAREDTTMLQITWRQPKRRHLQDVCHTTAAARRWAARCGRGHAGSAHSRTRAGLASSSGGVQGGAPAVPRPWSPRFWGGACTGQPAEAWSGRTGPLRRWPRGGLASMASRSVRVRGGPAVRAMACGPIARLTTISKPIRRSRQGPAKTSRPSTKGRDRRTGLAESS